MIFIGRPTFLFLRQNKAVPKIESQGKYFDNWIMMLRRYRGKIFRKRNLQNQKHKKQRRKLLQLANMMKHTIKLNSGIYLPEAREDTLITE